MNRFLPTLITSLIAGLLLASIGSYWPAESGVVLSDAESFRITQIFFAFGFGCASLLSLVAPKSPVGVVSLVLSAPLVLAILPRRGLNHIRLDDNWIWGVGVLMLGLAWMLRGRHRPRLQVGLAGTALASLFLAWPGAPQDKPAATSGPDILLLTLDTLRADHLDFNGGDVQPAITPHLSALAARSTVYRQAFAPMGLTGPSHTTMLTGDSEGTASAVRDAIVIEA